MKPTSMPVSSGQKRNERHMHQSENHFKVSAVVNSALHSLGLRKEYLVHILGELRCDSFQISKNNLDFEKINVTEWVIICNLLHLPFDSASYGYVYCEHQHRIGTALQNGLYLHPRTQALALFLKEFFQNQHFEILNSKKYYGDQLRNKIRQERCRQFIRRRKSRRINFQKYSLVRNALLQLNEDLEKINPQNENKIPGFPGLRIQICPEVKHLIFSILDDDF